MNITKEADEFGGAFIDNSYIKNIEDKGTGSNTCDLDTGECENCGS
jgi:hypothetical protein